jgi:hypothetical protein
MAFYFTGSLDLLRRYDFTNAAARCTILSADSVDYSDLYDVTYIVSINKIFFLQFSFRVADANTKSGGCNAVSRLIGFKKRQVSFLTIYVEKFQSSKSKGKALALTVNFLVCYIRLPLRVCEISYSAYIYSSH